MSAPDHDPDSTPERPDLAAPLPAAARPGGYSLVLNFLPLLWVLAGALLLWRAGDTGERVVLGLFWVYLLPPALGRLAMALWGAPVGDALDQSARAYKVWWLLMQLQLPFNRVPVFEELLRLVPGLYALWLNAWGARVSPVVFWGPGALVVDRHAVRVGPGAVIGTRAVLTGHLAVQDAAGRFTVTLAPVTVGAAALIGAYAGIGPGCVVAAGQEVPAARFLRPHTRWDQGRRVKALPGAAGRAG